MKKIVIDKDDLYQKYIVENLSAKDCAEYFGCSVSVLKERLKTFNITKSDELIHELALKSQSKKVDISKDVLVNIYIEQNKSIQECADTLNVPFYVVKRRLKEYGIKKSQEKFKEIRC